MIYKVSYMVAEVSGHSTILVVADNYGQAEIECYHAEPSAIIVKIEMM